MLGRMLVDWEWVVGQKAAVTVFSAALHFFSSGSGAGPLLLRVYVPNLRSASRLSFGQLFPHLGRPCFGNVVVSHDQNGADDSDDRHQRIRNS